MRDGKRHNCHNVTLAVDPPVEGADNMKANVKWIVLRPQWIKCRRGVGAEGETDAMKSGPYRIWGISCTSVILSLVLPQELESVDKF